LGLAGIGLVSATAGALLAVTLGSTPLMQRQLSAADASIFSQDERISNSNNLQLPSLTRPVNILVLGVSVLTSEEASAAQNLGYQAQVNAFDGLSDTMLLIRFNPETQKLAILSIPRDTRLEIPGYSTAKINAANVLGGPALAARATSDLLGGIGIDRYVTINVKGVQALVDALGGVNVYVPKDMKYQDDSQHLYINLKAGQQHLNGQQALQLLRFRQDAWGDIGRIQRQQMVMRALMEQSLNPATIARMPQILSVVQSYIDTNLSVEELVALVSFGAQIERSQVRMLTVPGDYSQPGEYDASYWLANQDRIATVMAQYFDFGTALTTASQPRTLRVVLQDGTRNRSAATALVSKLQAAGYESVEIDSDFREPLRLTRIVAQRGDTESAAALQQAIGMGEVRVESTGDLESDLTVQLGQDWLQRMQPARTDGSTRTPLSTP
jgi:LCP family protein required for cell wall assembly